jgi:hypothetical protein
MFRSLILAAVLLASAPLVANAGEITLLPSVKLQIGDRDDYGRYWDGGYWRDRDYWHRHYEWRIAGGNMIIAIGWYKNNAYERGYREGWDDRDDRRGDWGGGRSRTVTTNKKEPFGSFRVLTLYQPTTTGSAPPPPPRWPTRLVSPVSLTRSPIRDLLLVKISSGTSASAIPNSAAPGS